MIKYLESVNEKGMIMDDATGFDFMVHTLLKGKDSEEDIDSTRDKMINTINEIVSAKKLEVKGDKKVIGHGNSSTL